MAVKIIKKRPDHEFRPVILFAPLNNGRKLFSFLLISIFILCSESKALAQIVPSRLHINPISGIVLNAATGGPVSATLSFQSEPDLSEIHVVETDPYTGKFNVDLYDTSLYSVKIHASNFKPEIDTIYGSEIAPKEYRLLSVKQGEVLRLHRIYFDQGNYHIQDSSYQELSELYLLLQEYPNMIIQLEGHTDRLGGRQSNLTLSQNRVDEISRYLVSQGISPKRIKTRAFGGSKPLSTENTEESRQLNRRVEVRILKI